MKSRIIASIIVSVAMVFTGGVAVATPAQAAEYDPTFISVGYTLPVCFNGVLDNDAVIRSFNDPGGFESITFSLDGQALPGFPYALPTGSDTEYVFDDVVPADTPVGDHTLTVDNYGFVLATYPFTITHSCSSQSPGDFTVELDPAFVNPNTGSTGQAVHISNASQESRQAHVYVNDVLVLSPLVAAGASVLEVFEPPVCQVYTVKVSLGFPDLAFNETLPAIGCPPKATISTVPGANNLEKTVTVTNVSAEQLTFVVFAKAENGTDITKTPSPGDTSFTVAAGQSVTFDATVKPLPTGQTRYYFLLLPTVGDEEIGRSGLFSGTSEPVLSKSPMVTGTAKVGSTLTCSVAYVGATSQGYWWYANGVRTTITTKTLKLTSAHYNKRMACETSATNASGTTAKTKSPQTGLVALGAALKPVVKPSIAGKTSPGKILTARNGTWSPSATTYKYQWQRLVKGKWVNIAKATGKTYKVSKAYDNKYLRVVVTALKAGYNKGVFATARVYI